MKKPPGMSEFASTLGDTQRQGGGPGILALTRDPRAQMPVPVAGSLDARARAAAAQPRQVLSVFDTRPIASYDFAFAFTTTNNFDPASPFGSVTVPDGYTMVLRRVEFWPIPAFSGAAMVDFLSVRLTRDGVAIQLNEVRVYGSFDSYGFDTHQVAGQGHELGVSWSVGGAPASGDIYDIPFQLYGNLLRTDSRPPETEVGSPPLITRG